MEIERKTSAGRAMGKTRRKVTLRRINSDRQARSNADRRRAAARAKAAAAGSPSTLPVGIVGKRIKLPKGNGTPTGVALDRTKYLDTVVRSQYLERIRTARSSYFEEHAGGMSRQPSLADLRIVGQQVPVKTRALPAVKPSPAELEETAQKLMTREMEVEAVLRRDFTSSLEALEATRAALQRAQAFRERLDDLAKQSGFLAGAVFQELLARHAAATAAAAAEARAAELAAAAKASADAAAAAQAAAGAGSGSGAGSAAGDGGATPSSSEAAAAASAGGDGAGTPSGGAREAANGAGGGGGVALAVTPVGAGAGARVAGPVSPATRAPPVRGLVSGFRSMHLDRERETGKVPLETVTDVITIDAMVKQANELCALVRVKIEDDNDLGLASTVVEDSLNFFTDLVELAKWREMDVMALLEELRAF